MTVTVPKDEDGDPYDVIGNGELTKEEDKGDRVTRHWRSKEPMASYLANVTVGYFEIANVRTGDGLPVYLAVDPDESEAAEGLRDLVPQVIAWASKRFGPYPFSSTGAIVDHLPDLDYALETQTKPYFDSAPDAKLLVHELAHQWFGNSVTPRAWKDMWLNEGFANYAEWLWEVDHGGKTAQETFASYYDGTHPESEGIWNFAPADPPSVAHVSDPPVYGHGAMVAHKSARRSGTRHSSTSCGPGPSSTATRMPTHSSSSRCARGSPERTCPRSSTAGSSKRRSPPASEWLLLFRT
ncbi:M1 family aminopeptidase [Streptomyces sp. NPDC093589]|uniref:M1 family aminopeptidase n=1 Tax=Streptomyces sp. NPDC093589 TaxID=3366043 RepID=UPI00380C5585